MALFSIKRYLGENNDQVTSEKQESEILHRLQKEALLRLETNDGRSAKKRALPEDDADTNQKKKRKYSDDQEEKTEEQKTEEPMVDEINQELSGSSDDLVQLNDGDNNVVGGFTVLGEAKTRQEIKVKRVLPSWLSHPSVVSSDIRVDRVRTKEVLGLDQDMIKQLKKNGIRKFFPVQAQIIPALLRGGSRWLHLNGPAGHRPPDICCSAPTGSGKTLAYVVPIVQILKQRVVCRLRCLVVVPVCDLAAQVYKVFTDYCQNTNLRVGLMCGLKTFVQEQYSLVKKGPRGYSSAVDIVVCTPGRLVDHITMTQGFDLRHLRFLVIDEADRVMEDIKQDWLSLVEKAVHQEALTSDATILYLPSCRRLQSHSLSAENLAAKSRIPLQKLLFSATLSQDPEKLNQLKLFQPQLFTAVVKPRSQQVDQTEIESKSKNKKSNSSQDNATEDSHLMNGDFLDKFTTPVGLTEKFVECSKSEKPLALLYLLHHFKFKQVLCFTNSLESTHRLYQLIKLVGGVRVNEFSSRLQALRRNRILKQFAAGKVQLLISSDAACRGIDISDIDCVVSYDVPRALTTYVHRVGRTARAGRSGTAFTLLEKKEIFHFKNLLKEAGKANVKELKLKSSDLKTYVEPVTKALTTLPAVLKTEIAESKPKR